MKPATLPLPRNMRARLETSPIQESAIRERWGPPHFNGEGSEGPVVGWGFQIDERALVGLEYLPLYESMFIHANTADVELIRSALELDDLALNEFSEDQIEVPMPDHRELPQLELGLETNHHSVEAFVEIMFRTNTFERLAGLSRLAAANVITEARHWQTAYAPTPPEFEAFVRQGLTRDHCAEPARHWLEREALLVPVRVNQNESNAPRAIVHLSRSSPEEFVRALNDVTLFNRQVADRRINEAFRRGEQLRNALERFLENIPNASEDVFTAYLMLVFNSDIAAGLAFIERLGNTAAKRAAYVGPPAWRAAGFRREPLPPEFDAFVQRALTLKETAR